MFPSCYKKAQVLPLLKKAGLDSSSPANYSYRPISNLSTVSKVLERLVLTRLRPAGSEAESQPKSNLVHFSLKIWHLVATVLNFVPPNFLIFVPRGFLWHILRRRSCFWTPLSPMATWATTSRDPKRSGRPKVTNFTKISMCRRSTSTGLANYYKSTKYEIP